MYRPAALLCVLTLVACGNTAPEGLLSTPVGTGPRVVFDLDAKPLPDIPFPNDLATRVDASSPTGRRLNISLEAPTALEREVRERANQLDGFATFGPISVRFDAPIDVMALWTAQNDADPGNDAILVINIDPESPGFGGRVPLDVGGGHFPLVLRSQGAGYFPNDPRAEGSNLLLETVAEDRNRNGRLDPGEDTDFDGRLDVPNVFPGGSDPVDDLMTFYEVETDTLMVRPLAPLDERTTYAVVLTTALIDPAGEPVRSPFAYVHHTRQSSALSPLPDVLSEAGYGLDEVAFAWTFTTQSVTDDLLALRRGLYGQGPFAWLEAAYPPEVTRIDAFRPPEREEPHLLRREVLLSAFDLVAQVILTGVEPDAVDALGASYANIEYIVAGSFDTPYLLVDRDGIATEGYPADDNEIWEIDAATGKAVHGPSSVSWICFVPREAYRPAPGEPFPVSLYAHRFGSTRFEVLGYAGFHARFGLATCAIDAAGHGLPLPPEILNDPIIKSVLRQFDVELLIDVAGRGRARDLNNNGAPDSGGDFLTSDMLHTRDMLRQSVLDWMAFIRLLRSFDGTRTWSLPSELEGAVSLTGLAGDFDGDGVIDLGGPDVDYFIWGQSLGGILSSEVAALEPAVTAAVPVSGGGGLADIAVRSEQAGLIETVWLRVFGPLLVLGPPPQDESADARWLWWHVTDVISQFAVPVAQVEVEPGDRLILTNLRSGEHREVVIDADRRARVTVAADALSATEKRALLGLEEGEERLIEGEESSALGDPMRIEIVSSDSSRDRVLETFAGPDPASWQGVAFAPGSRLVAPMAGFGFERQTPKLRRFMGVAQTLIEPADPINYVALYPNPITLPDDPAEDGIRRVVLLGTLGDIGVPMSACLNNARVAGFLSPEEDAMLVSNFVYEGIAGFERFGSRTLFDPDDLDDNRDGFDAPSPSPLLRATVENDDGSVSGLRLAFIIPEGAHTFAFPSPQKDFDIETFLIHQIGHYFATRGRELSDDVCLEQAGCSFLPEAVQD